VLEMVDGLVEGISESLSYRPEHTTKSRDQGLVPAYFRWREFRDELPAWTAGAVGRRKRGAATALRRASAFGTAAPAAVAMRLGTPKLRSPA